MHMLSRVLVNTDLPLGAFVAPNVYIKDNKMWQL